MSESVSDVRAGGPMRRWLGRAGLAALMIVVAVATAFVVGLVIDLAARLL